MLHFLDNMSLEDLYLKALKYILTDMRDEITHRTISSARELANLYKDVFLKFENDLRYDIAHSRIDTLACLTVSSMHEKDLATLGKQNMDNLINKLKVETSNTINDIIQQTWSQNAPILTKKFQQPPQVNDFLAQIDTLESNIDNLQAKGFFSPVSDESTMMRFAKAQSCSLLKNLGMGASEDCNNLIERYNTGNFAEMCPRLSAKFDKSLQNRLAEVKTQSVRIAQNLGDRLGDSVKYPLHDIFHITLLFVFVVIVVKIFSICFGCVKRTSKRAFGFSGVRKSSRKPVKKSSRTPKVRKSSRKPVKHLKKSSRKPSRKPRVRKSSKKSVKKSLRTPRVTKSVKKPVNLTRKSSRKPSKMSVKPLRKPSRKSSRNPRT